LALWRYWLLLQSGGEKPTPGRLEEYAENGQGENSEEMKVYAECMGLYNVPDYRKALNCFNHLLELEPKNPNYHKMRRDIIKKLGEKGLFEA